MSEITNREERKNPINSFIIKIKLKDAIFSIILTVLSLSTFISCSSSRNFKKGQFDSYTYHYSQEAETVDVVFMENRPPEDSRIISGITKDVVRNAFNENIVGNLTPYEKNSSYKIRFNSEKNVFFMSVVTIDDKISGLIIVRGISKTSNNSQ